MRAVIQRVLRAEVIVEGVCVGSIGPGLLVLLGVSRHDNADDLDYLVQKTIGLRIFSDEAGKMNRSVEEAGGSVLVVSQFTLYGDARKGRRPSYDMAAAPAEAEHWYEQYVQQLRAAGLTVATGKFRAHMDVSLVNDGPVTLLLDSSKAF
jgi:D-aminoacyl-tRNA deacylase